MKIIIIINVIITITINNTKAASDNKAKKNKDRTLYSKLDYYGEIVLKLLFPRSLLCRCSDEKFQRFFEEKRSVRLNNRKLQEIVIGGHISSLTCSQVCVIVKLTSQQ